MHHVSCTPISDSPSRIAQARQPAPIKQVRPPQSSQHAEQTPAYHSSQNSEGSRKERHIPSTLVSQLLRGQEGGMPTRALHSPCGPFPAGHPWEPYATRREPTTLGHIPMTHTKNTPPRVDALSHTPMPY
ncbi:hypothetical protein CRENBAI_022269 [Crenichthys baileyi]|uniref:Uncharacterized protein n=1 Tax=Crenichthys baileyi TaxID=28760 RepID=A0AAV9SNQ4_9TELE